MIASLDRQAVSLKDEGTNSNHRMTIGRADIPASLKMSAPDSATLRAMDEHHAPAPLGLHRRPDFWVCLVALLGIRLLQLRSFGPVLHQLEWLDFAELALLVRGDATTSLSGWDLLRHLSYMSFSQGVLVIQGITAALGLVFENLTVALYGSALLLESLGFAALLALANRLRRTLWLPAALWVLAPSFVIIWHMLPYGNHAAFWFIPALFASMLVPADHSRRGSLASLALLGLLGTLAYRPLAIAAFSFSAIRAYERRWASAFAPLFGVVLAALLASILFSGDDVALAARFTPAISSFELDRAWNTHQFGAPRDSVLGHLYRLLLLASIPAGVFLSWTRRGVNTGADRVLRFSTLFALGATLPPLISVNAWPEYSLLGYFSRVLLLLSIGWCAEPAMGQLARAVAVLLALLAIPDGLELIRPDTWPATSEYDGVELRSVLPADFLDPDDLPFLLDLTTRFEGMQQEAWVLDDPRSTCGWRSWRWPNGPLVDPSEGVCTGWPSRALAEAVSERQVEGQELNLQLVGRLAWIVANRQIDQVEEALEGGSPDIVAPILDGARAERDYWSR